MAASLCFLCVLCFSFLSLVVRAMDDREKLCKPLWEMVLRDAKADTYYNGHPDIFPHCYTYPRLENQRTGRYSIVPQIGILWHKKRKHPHLVVYNMSQEQIARAMDHKRFKSGPLRKNMGWFVGEADAGVLQTAYRLWDSGYKQAVLNRQCVGFDRGHLAPFHDFAFYGSVASSPPKSNVNDMPSFGSLKKLFTRWEAAVVDVADINTEFSQDELQTLSIYLPGFNSFVLSNQVPQEKGDNSGNWRTSVEEALRQKLEVAVQGRGVKTAYIVTGTYWNEKLQLTTEVELKWTSLVKSAVVEVPSNLFKVAYVVDDQAGSKKVKIHQLSLRVGSPDFFKGLMNSKNLQEQLKQETLDTAKDLVVSGTSLLALDTTLSQNDDFAVSSATVDRICTALIGFEPLQYLMRHKVLKEDIRDALTEILNQEFEIAVPAPRKSRPRHRKRPKQIRLNRGRKTSASKASGSGGTSSKKRHRRDSTDSAAEEASTPPLVAKMDSMVLDQPRHADGPDNEHLQQHHQHQHQQEAEVLSEEHPIINCDIAHLQSLQTYLVQEGLLEDIPSETALILQQNCAEFAEKVTSTFDELFPF